MNYQAATIRRLQELGYDPAVDAIPPEVYDKVRLEVRSPKAIARDVSSLMHAKASKLFNVNMVSEEQAQQNLAACRMNLCGSYDRLSDGQEVCHRCNCHGKDLLLRVQMRKKKCPHDPPFWDNTALTVEGKPTDAG